MDDRGEELFSAGLLRHGDDAWLALRKRVHHDLHPTDAAPLAGATDPGHQPLACGVDLAEVVQVGPFPYLALGRQAWGRAIGGEPGNPDRRQRRGDFLGEGRCGARREQGGCDGS